MLIDSHAHLDMEDFDADRDQVIRRAKEAGVERIITIGIDVASSKRALEIAEANEGIFSTVGMHPHNAADWKKRDLETLAELASSSGKIVAWGEIGLDYNRDYAPHEKQIGLFEAQLDLSRDTGLPIIVHDRDAHKVVLEILEKRGIKKEEGVIHCFSGDFDLAMTFIKMGFFISIPGTVTYKKAATVKEVATQVPLDRLIVETDAPFLAPVPMRGKRNEPAFVKYTAIEIAALRGLDPEDLASSCADNARRLFRID